MITRYYSFGLKHKGYNNVINGTDHPYGYNGVEEQDELGLNMLSMDVRQFDPAIARWTSTDPVVHYSMSPYNAFDNNPVYWADPSGANSESLSADANLNECPSCRTKDDWENYYSQLNNVAASLGEDSFKRAALNHDHLNYGYDEDGHFIGYSNGEAIDLVRYDNRLEAFGDLVTAGLLIEAPATTLKFLSNLFKGGGDEAIEATAKAAVNNIDEFKKLISPVDEFDEATTLYRGMTGSESSSSSIFFTDNASVAASYVKNGGSVKELRISNFALSSLELSGNLQKFTGIKVGSSVPSTEFKFMGTNLVKAINQLLK